MEETHDYDAVQRMATNTYDGRGNQSSSVEWKENKQGSDPTWENYTTTYAYDLANQLQKTFGKFESTPVADALETHNFYNGDGQRTMQVLGQLSTGSRTEYFYTGTALLFTSDANGNKGEENILDPGGKIIAGKRFDGDCEDKFYFYNYDILGSVTNILQPDGTVAKGYDYDSFGNTVEKGDPQFQNSIQFTGAVQDKATGLYYMNARHYNPSSGRFLQQDTYNGDATSPWTQHLYAYTGNNPINMTDPTGHDFQSIIDYVIGAICGAIEVEYGIVTPDVDKQSAAFQKGYNLIRGNSSKGGDSGGGGKVTKKPTIPTGTLMFSSIDADIDWDGVNNAKGQDDQITTSFWFRNSSLLSAEEREQAEKLPDKHLYLNAEKNPYIVVQGGSKFKDYVGCVALVWDDASSQGYYAVVGDVGPSKKQEKCPLIWRKSSAPKMEISRIVKA
ncbi:hypothetical protein FACS189415_7460 [Bacteroidia bacterium]|nr:hypothetical protein FACS189415_7460 [Bacteroidia bacterium]